MLCLVVQKLKQRQTLRFWILELSFFGSVKIKTQLSSVSKSIELMIQNFQFCVFSFLSFSFLSNQDLKYFRNILKQEENVKGVSSLARNEELPCLFECDSMLSLISLSRQKEFPFLLLVKKNLNCIELLMKELLYPLIECTKSLTPNNIFLSLLDNIPAVPII